MVVILRLADTGKVLYAWETVIAVRHWFLSLSILHLHLMQVGGIETDGVPVLMVQAATPVPHPQAPDINNNNNNNNNINEDSKLLKPSPDDIVKEEDEDDAEEMSDDGGEEEEVEEEEEEPEMTVEQKKVWDKFKTCFFFFLLNMIYIDSFLLDFLVF